MHRAASDAEVELPIQAEPLVWSLSGSRLGDQGATT